MRRARKLTQWDETTLASVTGQLYLDPNGCPYLANGDPISRYRFRRLIDLGLITAQDRPLFPDGPSQVYGVNHARPKTP